MDFQWHSLLEETFEQIDVGIAHLSLAGQFVRVNRKFADITGYDPAELYELTFRDITYAEDLAMDLTQLPQLLAGTLNTYRREKRYCRKNGEIVWADLAVSVARDETAEPQYFIAAIKDISDRKQLERDRERAMDALAHSQAFYANILSCISDAVLLTDDRGDFVFVCPNIATIFGYSQEEVWEKGNLAALLGTDFMTTLDIPAVKRQGELPNQECSIVDRQGQIHDLLVNIKAVELDHGTLLYTCRDVTDRKAAEQILSYQAQRTQALLSLPGAAERLSELGFIEECERLAEDLTQSQFAYLNFIQGGHTHHTVWRSAQDSAPWIEGQIWSEVFQQRHPVMLNQYQSSLDTLQFIIHRIICVPVMAEGKVVMLMAVGNKTSDYTDLDVETLQLLANETWRIVHNKRTWTELQRLNQDLEERVQERTARLQLATQSAQVGIWDWDVVNDRMNWDDRMYEMYGYQYRLTGQEETIKLWERSLHPEDAPKAIATCQAALAGDQEFQITFRIVQPQGHIRWIEAHGLVQRDLNGVPLRMIGVNADITDRKVAEQKLQESEQFLQTILHTFPLRVFWKDRSLVYQGGNRLFLEDVGLGSVEDLVGKTDDDLPWSAEHRDHYVTCDRQVITSGMPQLGIIEPFLTPQGEQRWAETNKVPLRNLAGEIIGLVGIYQDITARQATEDQVQSLLRELQAFKAAIDASSILTITDHEGHITEINDRFCEISGYSREELLGQDHRIMRSGVHSQEFFADLWNTVIAGKIWRGVVCNRKKQGELYWVDTVIVPLLDSEGNPCQYLALRMDITSQKLAEQQIQRDSAFRQQILDNMTEGLCVCAILPSFPSIQFALWNPQMEAITGYSLEEVNQLRWPQLLYHKPEIRDRIIACMTSIRQNHKLIAEEWDIVRKDGQKRTIAISTCVLSKEENTPLVLALIQDISDRKAAELELQRSQTKFQRLVDDIGDEFVVFSHGGHPGILTYVSSGVRNIFGITREVCLGKGWVELAQWLPESLILAQTKIQELRDQRTESQRFDLEFIHPTGEQRTIRVSQHAAFNDRGVFVAIEGVIEDITRQKRYEAELQQTNQQLERATRLKDEFLANMSHELRTPLNAVLGMAEVLKENLFGPLNDQQMEAIQTIHRSGTHLLDLISDILDVSKMESGDFELHCEPTHLEYLCRSSMNFIQQPALKKQIHLQTLVPPPMGAVILDERRIRQALINLLSNAVKFTPSGGSVTLEVVLKPGHPSQDLDHIRFAVMDTGIGIAPENHGKLFQSFVQIDGSLNRQYGGTGLGLALVKRIAELHGGTVGCESQLGAGSCFWLEVPCELASLSPETVTLMDTVAPPSCPTRSPLILLAEDNEANVQTIQSYLGAKGYNLIVATNGEMALNLARSELPDLILMDMQLSVLDGFQVIELLRQDPQFRTLPIVALTALALPGDEERCLAAGATAYVSKPIKLKQLVATIDRLLQDHQG